MGYLIIGSHALQNHVDLKRKPRDIDIIADFETAKELTTGHTNVYPINGGKTLVSKHGGQIQEISIAWSGSTNAELLKMYQGQRYADLDLLYTLKMSHRYLRNSPFFYKTMEDIGLLRDLGAQIPEHLKDWYARRCKETYDYKHPDLNQNKDGFFGGDGVVYTYDHDTLHEAVAMRGVPVYKSYQKDDSEVLCDRAKWDAIGIAARDMAVAEECAVLALERSLIPYPGVMTRQQAFKFALMKVCTSITSGWFREYAWENHNAILYKYENWDYYKMFQDGLKDGIVKYA